LLEQSLLNGCGNLFRLDGFLFSLVKPEAPQVKIEELGCNFPLLGFTGTAFFICAVA
jgi:hypothetical protein